MSGYEGEAALLERRYTEAVGWALQYGIRTYRPDGSLKSLGELRDEIAEHTGVPEPVWPFGLGIPKHW